MKFEVLSRQKAKILSYNTNIDDCIIISITDVNSEPNRFCRNPHIKGVCHIKFDDVELGEPNCITKQDAIKIIKFIKKYDLNKINKIIVHCEAGISRSAGVCAALMYILNGSDMDIFNNPKFVPNMSCYRIILETYYGAFDKEEADFKINHNLKVWKQNNNI